MSKAKLLPEYNIKHISIGGISDYIVHVSPLLIEEYIETDDDSVHVNVKVKDGTLFFDGVKSNKITIYLNNLESIVSKGVSNITGVIKTKKLNVVLKGVGNINLEGRVENLDINNTGAGNINVNKLKADNVVAHLKGTGNINAFSFLKADLSLSGVGDIYIDLNNNTSKLKSNIKGLGKIKKIESHFVPHKAYGHFDKTIKKLNDVINSKNSNYGNFDDSIKQLNDAMNSQYKKMIQPSKEKSEPPISKEEANINSRDDMIKNKIKKLL